MPEKQANHYRILMKKSTNSAWRKQGFKRANDRPLSLGMIWDDGSKLRLEQLEDRRLLTGNLDFGDAPNLESGVGPGNYRTLLSDNGPNHVISPDIFMGAAVDGEADAVPNDKANGDDIDQALPDDEDGVSNPVSELAVTVGSQPEISVNVTNKTGKPAYLSGWIDINSNGKFEETERGWVDIDGDGVLDDEERGATVGFVDKSFKTLTFPIIQSGFPGSTYARFRFSTDIRSTLPTGSADDGEVEDYVIRRKSPVDISDGAVGGGPFISSSLPSNGFGSSLVSLGDLDGNGVTDIAVSAPSDDTGGDNLGAVHILLRNDDGTVKSTHIIASGVGGLGELDDFGFGSSLDAVRDSEGNLSLLVGAPRTFFLPPGQSYPNHPIGGAVFLLDLQLEAGSVTVKKSTKITAATVGLEPSGDFFSFAEDASFAGDIDKNGVADILVTDHRSTGLSSERNIYLLLMNSDGTIKPNVRQFLHPTREVGDTWGSAFTSVGDIDGDQVPDLAFGEPGASDGRGVVDLLFMNSDGTVKSTAMISDQPVGTLHSRSNRVSFGRRLSGLGDFNQDGVPDLGVGESGFVTTLALRPDGGVFYGRQFDNGRAFAALEGDGGRFSTKLAIANSSGVIDVHSLGDHFVLSNHDRPELPVQELEGADTRSVTVVGDLNGDGVTDLVLGIPDESITEGLSGGGLRIFQRDSNGDVIANRTTLIASGVGGMGPLAENDRFGASVSPIGDRDGDGTPDLIVGAPGDDGGKGTVYVLHVKEDGTAKSYQEIKVIVTAEDGQRFIIDFAQLPYAPTELGISVSRVGDVNGDGIEDLAVSAGDVDGNGAGVFLLFMNSDFNVDFENIHLLDGNASGIGNVDNSWGSSVVGLGDVDGDAVPDLAVGAPSSDQGKGTVDVVLLDKNGTAKSTKTIGDGKGGLSKEEGRGSFGTSLAALGDVDGDHVPDLAVGGHTYAEILLLNYAGSVAAHYRYDALPGLNSPPLVTALALASPPKVTSSGAGIRFSIIAGASRIQTRFLFWSAAKFFDPPAELVPIRTIDDSFGYSWTTLDDTDGNGWVDVAMGAPSMNAVDVFLMRDGTVERVTEISSEAIVDPNDESNTRWIQRGGFQEQLHPDAMFGHAVSRIGDLNGDGITDLAVGAPGAPDSDFTSVDPGSVYVLLLNEDGTVAETTKISSELNGAPHMDAGDRFGSAIAALGDLDGDGIVDMAVGAADYDPWGLVSERRRDGAVYILLLNPDGSVKRARRIDRETAGLTFSASNGKSSYNGQFGASIAALGDVNGDGYTDLAIAQPGSLPTDPTAIHVLLLNANDETIQAQRIEGEEVGAADFFFGTALFGMGDVNGDAVPDLGAYPSGGSLSFLTLNRDGSLLDLKSVEGSWEHGAPAQLDEGFVIGTSRHRVGVIDVGDLGDAPDTGPGTGTGNYNTNWTDDGPVHVNWNPDLAIGQNIRGWHTKDGVNDAEDALTFVGGDVASIEVAVSSLDSTSMLYGWIDYNFDGVFDNETERASVEVPMGTSAYNDDSVRLVFPPPPTGIDGRTYARIRLSTDEAAANPTGRAEDGEVEDYAVTIFSPETLAVKDTLDFNKPGGQIARLGDVNGDEIDDIAVGANRIWLMTEQDTIAQEIVRDLPSDLLPQAGIRSLAAMGDFNNDGIPDLVLGAPAKDGPDESNTTGAIYVVLLDRFGQAMKTTKIASGLNGGPVLIPNRASDATNGFGKAITAIGDLNNDGFTELAVSDAEENVYTLFMKQDAISGDIYVENYVVNSSPLGNLYEFGSSLASLGYFDNDTVPDLVVGAPRYRDSIDNDWSGAVFVVLMNADGTFKDMTRISASTGMPVVKDDWFGSSISVLGDVNDDGITDLAVSAPGSFISDRPGTLYAVYLSPEGERLGSSVIGKGHVNGVRFGATLATLGDLDDNGIQDVAVNRGNRPRFLYLTRETPDFSDAPESYGVATHTADPKIFMGGFVDGEPSVTFNTAANGDDLDGFTSDEDGLVNADRDLVLNAGEFPTIDVWVSNRTGSEATLYGWIDLDGNGVFDESERASTGVPDGTAVDEVTLAWSVSVPESFAGIRYARFRLSADPAAADPTGAAEGGEVEDYVIAVPDTDFGDAPDADTGPSHKVSHEIYLGQFVDAELEGLPSVTASSDDAFSDDEDGLVSGEIVLIPGETESVSIAVTNLTDSAATLYAWIDTDGNGAFDNNTERQAIAVASGTLEAIVTLDFPVPTTAAAGQFYARFRLSTDPSAADPMTAATDGEVEDYVVTIVNSDFGDAPQSYGNPSHKKGASLFIGSTVDLETNSLFSVGANGDDLTGSSVSDEDGLVNPQALLELTPGVTPTVEMRVTNDTGMLAKLYGWIDLNLNGSFDLGERQVADVEHGMNADNGDFVTLTFPEIAKGLNRVTYARFRLSTDDAAMFPTGPAVNGEVEDYRVTITGSERGGRFTEFFDPNPNVGNRFGDTVVPLENGNVLVTSPFDDAGGTDAGAVYLFNGSSGALISTLVGAHANDQIG